MQRFLIVLLLPLCCFGQSLKGNVNLLIEQKQFVKAQDTLQKILKNRPNNLEAIELLGDVYCNQVDWDNAIEQYEKLLELKSDVANYQYKYGGALGMKALSVNKLKAIVYLGDMEDAFLKAADLDPNHIETRWALARFYMHVPGILGGSKDKAWKYTDELMKLSPVDGYLSKGHYYEDEDEFEKAESYYKHAIKIGESFTCYQHLSDLYLKFKKPEQALKAMETYYEKKKDKAALEVIETITKEHGLTSRFLK